MITKSTSLKNNYRIVIYIQKILTELIINCDYYSEDVYNKNNSFYYMTL